jgi:hypothetical protein
MSGNSDLGHKSVPPRNQEIIMRRNSLDNINEESESNNRKKKSVEDLLQPSLSKINS